MYHKSSTITSSSPPLPPTHYLLKTRKSLCCILSTFLSSRHQENKHKHHMQEHDLGEWRGRFFITLLSLNGTELQSFVYCNFVWESLANLHFFPQRPWQKMEEEEEEDNYYHHHPRPHPASLLQPSTPVPYQLLLGARKWRKEGCIAITRSTWCCCFSFTSSVYSVHQIIFPVLVQPPRRRGARALAMRSIAHSFIHLFSQ